MYECMCGSVYLCCEASNQSQAWPGNCPCKQDVDHGVTGDSDLRPLLGTAWLAAAMTRHIRVPMLLQG